MARTCNAILVQYIMLGMRLYMPVYQEGKTGCYVQIDCTDTPAISASYV